MGLDSAVATSTSLKGSVRSSLLAIIDQCLFSGTNFLTAIWIGRVAGASELGVYSLCFSLTMICIATQRALLISPFVVVSAAMSDARMHDMRGSVLIATVILACALSVLSIAALVFVSPIIVVALMVTLPAGLLRDFHRRISIAQLQLVSAIQFDVVIAVCQLAALYYVASMGKLTAVSTLFVCSFVWIATSVVTFVLTRDRYGFCRTRLREDIALLWPIGRWVGLSQLVSTAQAFSLPWVMAVAGSLKLAGIYAACWSIVQVASPVIEGLGNLLGPALARSANAKSLDGLKQRSAMATVVFSALMTGLVVVVAIFGRQILQGLYGASFAGAYPILLLSTLASAVLNVGIPASKALTQIGKANWNFSVAGVSLLITLAMAAVALSLIGQNGAAWGLLAGAVVSTIVRWVLFHWRFQQLASGHEESGIGSIGHLSAEGGTR